jgi:hypothetical protein
MRFLLQGIYSGIVPLLPQMNTFQEDASVW